MSTKEDLLLAEIADLRERLYRAENPAFNGRFDSWQAACGKARGESESLRNELRELKAENESLRKDAELIASARDLYRGDAIVHAGTVVRLEHEIQNLRKALRTIRDESEDLGASECAADALIDAAISSPENPS